MRLATSLLLSTYIGISLYLDRCHESLSVYQYWCLLQLSLTLLTLVLVLWLTDWYKVLAFALLALTYTELFQQLVNGNTETTIRDDAALFIVAASLVGFILVRRFKNKL